MQNNNRDSNNNIYYKTSEVSRSRNMINFANEQQKRFHFIWRAFKIGNIIATIVLLGFIVKYFLGV